MRNDPVFPSLGSTIGGVTSYVVSSEGAGGCSVGSMTTSAPVTYISFQHPVSVAAPAMQDEIRTVFVTGFPDNVHERELHNLCRFMPGYEASQASIKPNQQPQVFVLFQTAAHARQALEALAGLPFDVQLPLVHSVSGKVVQPGAAGAGDSAATSSSSISLGSLTRHAATPQQQQPAAGGTQAVAAAQQALPGTSSAGDASGPVPDLAGAPEAGPGAPHANPEPLAQTAPAGGSVSVPLVHHLRCEVAHKNLYVKAVGGGMVQAVGGGMAQVAGALSVHPLVASAAGTQQQPMALQHHVGGGVSAVPLGTPLGFLPVTNRGDNPPCNTLFIGNLSDQVSELELLHLLSGQPGYRQMKLVRGPRQVSCFVEFEDLMSAMAVHNAYQGAVLASSDRGGIRIQYSKNPFGKRSSNPGSNVAALRQAVGLQNAAVAAGIDPLTGVPMHAGAGLMGPGGAGMVATGLGAMGVGGAGTWPVVTYHTVPQAQQHQQLQAHQGQLQAPSGAGFYY